MDVLRGVAVLGILLMNIIGFAYPFAASFDPTLGGGYTGANLWIWAVNTVLFEGKMRAIFSMLFGAGMLVLTSRLEQHGAAGEAADVYYRRLLWLLAFGLVHAYFIWWGDILFFYAALGLLLFPFRRLSGRALVTIGLVLLLMGAGRGFLDAWDLRRVRAEAAVADAVAAAGGTLTEEQKGAQTAWKARAREAKPSPEALKQETEAYQSGYWAAFRQRAGFLASMQASALYHFFIFDIGGMMMLGIGVFKLGLFSAGLPARTYAMIALVGFGIGLPIASLAVRTDIVNGFDPVSLGSSAPLHAIARIPIAGAHVAVVMLICRAGILRWLTTSLAAVGQTAFSCYIATSIICTTVFYGYGLGYFARLQRYQVYYVVAGVWIALLIAAPIWLRHFRFGPLEWLWRSLTYVARQPMRRRDTVPSTPWQFT
jgi:uncharacterized protein